MSVCAYTYHFNFVLEPKSHPITQVSVCEVKRYIEVEILVDVPSENVISEQLNVASRLFSVFNHPVENVTWEQRRLDDIEVFLNDYISKFTQDAVFIVKNPALMLNPNSKEFVPMNIVPMNIVPIKTSHTEQKAENMHDAVDHATCHSISEAIMSSENRPALDMSTNKNAKKLRNYVDNITRGKLSSDQLEFVCKWLVSGVLQDCKKQTTINNQRTI